MSHYEQRMQEDLDVLHDRVAEVGKWVDTALAESVQSLLTLDRELSGRVILGDLPINRAIREIDRLCHVFVARHLPSAGVLRYVSSILRADMELERVGDYAVTIAREAVQLEAPPPKSVADDIELLTDQARSMLSQALEAFGDKNAELARGTKTMAAQAKGTSRKMFDDLLSTSEAGSRPTKDLFALLLVLNRLERVAAQAKNLCEDTLFAAIGETKPPKVYRVLFVDEDNAVLSVLAEAVARRNFPESGSFESAGWNPAPNGNPSVLDFLDRKGLRVGALAPRALPEGYRDLDDFHVIVGVGTSLFGQLPEIPFRTAVIRWDLGDLPDLASPDLDDGVLEDLYKRLSAHARELMETLRGKDAN